MGGERWEGRWEVGGEVGGGRWEGRWEVGGGRGEEEALGTRLEKDGMDKEKQKGEY